MVLRYGVPKSTSANRSLNIFASRLSCPIFTRIRSQPDQRSNEAFCSQDTPSNRKDTANERGTTTGSWKMEPAVGIEPTTDGLQNRCSTTELRWPRRAWNQAAFTAVKVGDPSNMDGRPPTQQSGTPRSTRAKSSTSPLPAAPPSPSSTVYASVVPRTF
jgi:hypothetical protein